MTRLDGLSPKLKIAAEFVMAHPDEVATRALRQVAKAANLTPPTLSRLARALDFETYEELREICRGELKRRNRVLADKAQALLQLSSADSTADKSGVFLIQARSAMENIQDLMGSVELDKLRAAADTLAHARKVVLIGATSGMALGSYFCCMASMAFDNWRTAGTDGAFWASEMAKLGPEDAVFVVSLQPYGTRPVHAAEIARDAGAAMIAITDSLQSPYAGIATNCFVVKAEGPQFFPSHVAPLVLIEGLMGMVVRRAGKTAVDRIRSTELMAHELQEYWVNYPSSHLQRKKYDTTSTP
ncbi:MAG: MurR/RpiR family transcriptional regulator [Rhodospirillaceae bacterium]|nr:MurR/RpiR family transcriptional regulator [Rhodospirillaceae bacterium]